MTKDVVVHNSFETLPVYLQAQAKKTTRGLINCNIRFIPSGTEASASKCENLFRYSPFNDAESKAAAHFENLGYKVIRLSHFVLSFVGWREGGNEFMPFEEAKILGEALRSCLNRDIYDRLIYRSEKSCRAMASFASLCGVDPRLYPLCFYPPDFLIAKPGKNDFAFIEVKSSKDKLHFRQANWFINLLPDGWPYEICIVLPQHKLNEEVLFTASGSRTGDAFSQALESKLADVAAGQKYILGPKAEAKQMSEATLAFGKMW